jgi:uncharacterized protein
MIESRHLCRPVWRHYRAILAVSTVATLVGGWLTTKLKLDSDLAALLPESFESVKALRRMEGEVGGTSQLRIALKTEDFGAAVSLAEALSTALPESEYVGNVDYQNDVDFYEENALLFLDMEELDSLEMSIQDAIDAEKQKLNPFMVDDLFGPPPAAEEAGDELGGWEERYQGELPSRYYLNADSTVLVMSVLPAQTGVNLAYSRTMLADVRRIVEEVNPTGFAPDMQLFYGSNIKNRIDEFEAISSDIVGTAAYGISGVFLLLVIVFRSLIIPVIISLTLAASLSWTFGLTFLLVGQLNTITGFLFVVLFGMGVDYGIHAMARYVESRQGGLDADEAFHRMVCRTGTALGTTALTTSAAFFSLMLLDFKGFSELGLISGIGMIFAWIAMVVLLPAFVVLTERLGLLKVKPVPGKKLSSDRRPLPYARTILVGASVLTLVSAVLFTKVGFQYDFTNLRIITPEREQYSEVTQGVFTRSESPAIVLASSREEVAEIVDRVEEIMRTDTLTPTVESVRSILSVVPDNQNEKLDKIREIRALVEDEADGVLSGDDARRVERLQEFLAVNEPFSWNDFPEKDRERFTNKEGKPGNFVLIYPGVPLRDGRNAIRFRDDIGEITTASGKVFHAGSSNLIVADMLTMIAREGPLAVALSVAVVFLIILANFRSLRAALFVLTPLLVGVVWMGGAMELFGMQLNFFNVVVFPSLIGIGVDNGIHIHHRYLEEGPGSLPFVLKRTGMAIVLTTSTTIIGYSGLVMAHHPGLQSIGELAVIGLVATLLSAFFVLPALLERFGAADEIEA